MTFWTTLLMAASLGQAPALPVDANPAAVPHTEWSIYQATVSSYLGEALPPPAPIPVAAPPAAIGLSEPMPAAAGGQAACCDPSAQAYVDNLYADGYCQGDCNCKKCRKGKHGGKSKLCGGCGIHSTCDMYPHYAYYPKHHGYYYFRPYNYTNVLAQQQIAVRLGGDARYPYSAQLLANLNQSAAQPAATSTKVLRQGPMLPLLEELVDPKPSTY